MMVVGPSGGGKTVFVTKMFEEKLLSVWPGEVYVFCGEREQPEYRKWEQLLRPAKVMFEEQPPTEEFYEKLDSKTPRLIIVDDLMDKAGDSQVMADLFTRGSHHRNADVIFIMQNLFPKGKHMRTLSVNAQYMVLLKNPRDKAQIHTLDSQMFPGRGGLLTQVYDKATSSPFAHLIVDTKQETAEFLRMRSIHGKNTRVFLRREVFKSLPVYKKSMTPRLEKSPLK
jgi:hypothetical protein